MIVECTECQTRFQLDESRVPASGIRVRCSRCKHAFFLKPPGKSRADGVHAAAEEAAVRGSVPPPSATQDLPGPARVVPANARGGGSETEDEESDWEFNEEIPDPSAREESARGFGPSAEDLAPAVDGEEREFGADDLESERLASPGGADPQVDPLDGIGDVAPSEPVAPEYTGRPGSGERDETAFGSVDELGDLGADDPSSSAARATGGEELDDPESWDFFGDSQTPATGGARMAIGILGRSGVEASARADEEPDRRQNDEPVGLDTVPTRPLGPGRLAPWMAGVSSGIGWLATLGMLAVGLAHGLWPAWRAPVEQGVPTLASGLRAEGVAVRWIESAQLGRLMVVTGGLRAPVGRPTAPVGELEVALLDSTGRNLGLPGIPVGAPLPEVALREWNAEALDDSRARAATELASREIGSGQVVPFQAVVEEVPFEAQRIDLRDAAEVQPPSLTVGESLPEPTQDQALADELDLIEPAEEATGTPLR